MGLIIQLKNWAPSCRWFGGYPPFQETLARPQEKQRRSCAVHMQPGDFGGRWAGNGSENGDENHMEPQNRWKQHFWWSTWWSTIKIEFAGNVSRQPQMVVGQTWICSKQVSTSSYVGKRQWLTPIQIQGPWASLLHTSVVGKWAKQQLATRG